ncbi:MAG: HD-GYP domain-containing protein [Thermodesulfovibrionales bacterium]
MRNPLYWGASRCILSEFGVQERGNGFSMGGGAQHFADMRVFEIAYPLLVLAGAIIILVSISIALKITKEVSADLRRKWLSVIILMGFFFAGYLIFFSILVDRVSLSPETLVVAVFFGGSLFVFIVMKISETTIRRTRDQDREIQQFAQGLQERAVALEREVAERQRAENQAKSRLQDLSALHTIDMIISSSHDLHITLKIFLEQAVSRLHVDAACVLLLDQRTQMLRFAAGTGFRTGAVQDTLLRVGQGAAGIAALERRIVTVSDIASQEESFGRWQLAREESFVWYLAVPLVAKAQARGVLELFHRRALETDSEWTIFLNALALQAGIAIDNTTLFDDLQRSNVELLLAYDSTLEGWSRALELRDKETEGHTRRVVDKTMQIAREMGLNERDLVHVRRGALLHDIGKMGVPDGILFKGGGLTPDEMSVMRHHPVHAFELLSPIVYLRPALDIPYCHHERWDGTGYPRGLRGEQIPLAARIFAVVDTWDALCFERRYHGAWTPQEACAHIRSLSGSQFDRRVVEVFLRLYCRGLTSERS